MTPPSFSRSLSLSLYAQHAPGTRLPLKKRPGNNNLALSPVNYLCTIFTRTHEWIDTYDPNTRAATQNLSTGISRARNMIRSARSRFYSIARRRPFHACAPHALMPTLSEADTSTLISACPNRDRERETGSLTQNSFFFSSHERVVYYIIYSLLKRAVYDIYRYCVTDSRCARAERNASRCW